MVYGDEGSYHGEDNGGRIQENNMGNYAQNHSLRIQNRQFESVFQSKTPSRAISLASLAWGTVGLGVREAWKNSCFPGISH